MMVSRKNTEVVPDCLRHRIVDFSVETSIGLLVWLSTFPFFFLEVDVQESMLESASVIATLRKTCNNSSYSCIDRCNGTSEEKSPTCSCESNCQDLGTCCADYLFSSCVDIPLVRGLRRNTPMQCKSFKKLFHSFLFSVVS